MNLIHLAIFVATLSIPIENGPSDSASPKSEKITTPSPMDLSTNWWDYFKYDSELTEDRIKHFLNKLQELQTFLTPEEIEQTSPYITKILIQLDAYKSLKVPPPKEVTPYPFHKDYTINQLLDLADSKLATESDLEQDKKERFKLLSHKTKLEQHLDKQSVQYFSITENTPEKLILGLDIISTRFAIGVKNKLIKAMDYKIQYQTEKLNLLDKELSHAFSNLEDKNLNISRINSQIESLTQELQKRQSESLRAELKAMSHYGTGDKNEIQTLILNQNAIDSLLEDAITNSEIQTLELISLLAQEEQSISSNEIKNTLDKISKIESTLNDISKAANEWESISSEDLEITVSENKDPQMAKLYEEYGKLQKSSLEKIKILKDKLFFAFLLTKNLDKRFQSQQSTWFCCWYSIEGFFEDIITKMQEFSQYRVMKFGELPITISTLFWAIVTFSLILGISSLIRKSITKLSKRVKRFSDSSIYVIDRLIYYITLPIAAYFFLYALGFDTSNILILLGGLSVGIGFGLQGIVNNFVSSIILLIHGTIKIGDYLKLPTGEWGRVIDVNVQNTIMHTWDGTDIMIPNSELLTQKYENWTLKDHYKRLHIPFSVAYDSDKDLVVEVATEAAKKVPCTIHNHYTYPDPAVWLTRFLDSALEFELIVWVDLSAQSGISSFMASYHWELESALKEHGIKIPFPQRDVHIYNQPNPT